MPLRVFPSNPVLSSVSVNLDGLSQRLRYLTSTSNPDHLDIVKSQNALSEIKLLLAAVIVAFEKEKERLKKSVTRWFTQGEIQRLELEKDTVRREVERAIRGVEWRRRELAAALERRGLV